jgi:hypothetical protein
LRGLSAVASASPAFFNSSSAAASACSAALFASVASLNAFLFRFEILLFRSDRISGFLHTLLRCLELFLGVRLRVLAIAGVPVRNLEPAVSLVGEFGRAAIPAQLASRLAGFVPESSPDY